MEKKKLTLEDLKLESFLTELDDSNLMKVQGGMGGYDSDQDEDRGDDEQQGTPYDDQDLIDHLDPDEDPTNYTPEYDDTPYTDGDFTDQIDPDEEPTNYTPDYGDGFNRYE